MATPPKPAAAAKPAPSEEPAPEQSIPSELDDLTHAELLVVYKEAADNVLFAKGQQWRTLGQLIVLFAMLVALAFYVSSDTRLVSFIFYTSFLFSLAALIALVMFQVWQNNEQEKIHFIVQRLGSVTRRARRLKPRREADLHRYFLLFIMMLVIVLANIVVARALTRLL